MKNKFDDQCRKLIDEQGHDEARKRVERGLHTLSLRDSILKPSPPAFMVALHLLELFDKRKAVSVLLHLLHSRDESNRWEAAKSLIHVDSKLALRGCLKLLASDAAADTREAAAYVLTFSRGQLAVPALLCVFANEQETVKVRAQAAEGLGNLLHLTNRRKLIWRQAAESLLLGLSDPLPEVRFWSAYALGMMRCENAVPKLEELASTDKTFYSGWWTVGEEASDAAVAIRTGYWPDIIRVGKQKTTN
jgi:HEAT repeat protein